MSETLGTETVLQHLFEKSAVAQRLRVEGRCRGTSDLREIVSITLDLANDTDQQLIHQLTEALRNVTAAIVAIQDSPDARFSTETKKAIREADAIIRATVAKERAS